MHTIISSVFAEHESLDPGRIVRYNNESLIPFSISYVRNVNFNIFPHTHGHFCPPLLLNSIIFYQSCEPKNIVKSKKVRYLMLCVSTYLPTCLRYTEYYAVIQT